MLKKAKIVFLLIMTLVFALQGVGMETAAAADATIDNDVTIERLKEGLGASAYYGVIAHEYSTNNHSEASIFVDKLDKETSDPIFASSYASSHMSAEGIKVQLDLPNVHMGETLTFGLYTKNGENYVDTEYRADVTVTNKTSATVDFGIVDDYIASQDLYVFQVENGEIVNNGALNTDGMKVEYGPAIKSGNMLSSYVGDYATTETNMAYLFQQKNSEYEGPYHGLELGNGIRLYYKDDNSETGYTLIPESSKTGAGAEHATDEVYIYDTDWGTTEGKYNAKRLDSVCYDGEDIWLYTQENKEYKLNLKYYNEENRVAGVLAENATLSEFLATQDASKSGKLIGEISEGPVMTGNSTYHGPENNGAIVSLYSIKMGANDGILSNEDLVQLASGSYKTDFQPDHDGFPIAANEYIVMNVYVPAGVEQLDMTGINFGLRNADGSVDNPAEWKNRSAQSHSRLIWNIVNENGTPFTGDVRVGSYHGGMVLAPKADIIVEAVANSVTLIGETVDQNGVEIHQNSFGGSRTFVRMVNEPTVTLKGTKNWFDYGGYGRPGKIRIELYANGVKKTTFTVEPNEKGVWSWEITDLPKTDNGNDVVYEIKEIPISYYTTQNGEQTSTTNGSGDKTITQNITNSYEQAKIVVNGVKTWVDGNDQDGIRPDTVTITLESRRGKSKPNNMYEIDWEPWKAHSMQAGNSSYDDTRVLSDENGWEYNFSNLWSSTYGNNPMDMYWWQYRVVETKFDGDDLTNNGGSLYKGQTDTGYDVTYSNNGEDYFTQTEDYNITNTHQPQFIKIKGEKCWQGYGENVSLPGTINIDLYRNGERYGNNVQTTAETNWKFEFTNLPSTDGNGNSYEYTVREAGFDNSGWWAEQIIHEDEYGNQNIRIVNTLRTIQIKGKKEWAGGQNYPPNDHITINIMRVMNKNDEDHPEDELKDEVVASLKASQFEQGITLPACDAAGNTAVYYPVEVEYPGYSPKVELEKTTTSENGMTVYEYKITNTLITTEVKAIKVWDDGNNALGTRPQQGQIRFMVQRRLAGTDGQWNNANEQNWTFTINDETKAGYNNVEWNVEIPQSGERQEFVFGNLPAYSHNDKAKWEYRVIEEAQLNGYTSVSGEPVVDQETGNTTVTITNTYEIKKVEKELTLTKTMKLEGVVALPADQEFSFTVTPVTADHANGYKVEEPGSMTFEAGTANNTSKSTMAKFEFTKPGTYVFEVAETTGNAANVTYAQDKYTVTYVVADDMSDATVTIKKGTTDATDVVFENTYAVKEISITKVWEGGTPEDLTDYLTLKREKTGTETEDTVVEVDFIVANNVYTWQNLPKYDANGNEYVYYVLESQVPGFKAPVYMDANDNLKDVNAAYNGDKIKNMVAPASGSVAVTKTLSLAEGSTLASDLTFTFKVEKTSGADDGYTIDQLSKSVTFKEDEAVEPKSAEFALTFTKAGTYIFTITEEAGNMAGVTYDPAVYTVTYNVTEGLTGVTTSIEKKASAEADAATTQPETVTFANSYAQPTVTAEIKAQKTVDGSYNVPNDTFEFELWEITGESRKKVGSSVWNDGDKIDFPAITYTEANTYNYVIKEVEHANSPFNFDTLERPVTVVVTKNETTGELSATVDYDGSNTPPVFANTTKPIQVSVPVKKTVTGVNQATDDYEFELMPVESDSPWSAELTPWKNGNPTVKVSKSALNEQDEDPLTAVADFGTFVYPEEYKNSWGGAFRYLVRETSVALQPGWTYDTRYYWLTYLTGDTNALELEIIEYCTAEDFAAAVTAYDNSHTEPFNPPNEKTKLWDVYNSLKADSKLVDVSPQYNQENELISGVEAATFVNEYVEVKLTEELTLTKTMMLEGVATLPAAQEFSFTVTPVTVADANGYTLEQPDNVSFGTDTVNNTSKTTKAKFEFTKPGTYKFEVAETVGTAAGITYAQDKYTVTYVVADGMSDVAVTIEDAEAVVFENIYAVKDVSITKQWPADDNGQDISGMLTLHKLENGVPSEKPLTGYGPTWDEATDTYTWSGMDAKDENGQTITYVVKETAPTGYVAEYPNNQGYAADGQTITNTKITGTFTYFALLKTVDPLGNAEPTGDATFHFEVKGGLKDSSIGGTVYPYSVTVNNSGASVKLSFDEAGTYVYEIYEVEPDAVNQLPAQPGFTYTDKKYKVEYVVELDGTQLKIASEKWYVKSGTDDYQEMTAKPDYLEFINKYTLMNISVEKVWDDANNQDGGRPDSITINLLADGVEVAEKTLTATSEGATKTWPTTYVFENLPKYNSEGKEITYTVSEDTVQDYTTTVDNKNYIITNKYAPGMVSISVTKVWDDNNAANRPAIELTLYKDNDVVVTDTQGNAVAPSVSGDVYTWSNLPEKENGKTINYYVKEDAAAQGYKEPVYTNTDTSVTDKALNGGTIKNTLAEGDASLDITKSLINGAYLATGQTKSFTFKLYEYDNGVKGAEIAATTIALPAADGSVENVLGEIKFGLKFGTHTYLLEEVKGTDADIDYDGTQYKLEFDVGVNKFENAGTLGLNDYKFTTIEGTEVTSLTFTNTYKYEADGKLHLEGTKKLTGDVLTMAADQFTFAIFKGDVKVADGHNTADGKIVFDEIVYSQSDIGATYLYTVKELPGVAADATYNYTYDDTMYNLSVSVTDGGNGALIVSKSITKGTEAVEAIEFTNTIKNKVGDIGLMKVDKKDTTKGLADAVFGVYAQVDAEGKIVKASWVGDIRTGLTGGGILQNLPIGTYYVQESMAPKGYQLDETVYTVVVQEGETTMVNGDKVLNTKLGRLMLQKSDRLNPDKKLPGAVYTLYNDEACLPQDKVADITTGDDGVGYLDDVAPGTYWVKETKAPEGYEVDPLPYKVVVGEDADPDQPAFVQVSDFPLRGALTISKTVVGVEATTESFLFDIELSIATADPIVGSYEATLNGVATEKVTFAAAEKGAKATVSLKSGETLVIRGLRDGVTYTVTEQPTGRYDVMVNNTKTNVATGTIKENAVTVAAFQNTLKQTGFTVEKVWQGAEGGEIELTLFANGVKVEPQPKYTKEGNKYTYADLTMVDEKGQEILYTVKETAMAGYTTSYKNIAPYADKTDCAYNGGQIINQALTSFSVKKEWTGLAEGETAPAIQLTLYCNGAIVTKATPKPDAKGWYVYTDLPATVDGKAAVYTVKEEPLSGYTTTYINKGENAAVTDCAYNGSTIVNSKIPQTGDGTPLALWMTTMLLAALGLVGLKAYSRKREN